MTKIIILTGSTRPGRFNVQPANWIHKLAKKRDDMSIELIDLEKINLPFLDEPVPPKMNSYSKDHTKDWSKKISEGDGFIWITPEYNHSYSSVLKNAVDYLFYEWNYKPVSFVSYGSEAGGSRAVEHLRGVAGELKMFDLSEQVLIPNYWERTNAIGEYQFSEKDQKAADSMISALSFWSSEMKIPRRKILSTKS